jgi:tetratricopeptide (TPR) repeat protein
MDVARTVAAAVESHQRGKLAEAEALYRQALAVEPGNADALHLLGVIAYQTGRLEYAGEYIARAIEANPRLAEAHNSMGNVLRAKGKLAEGVAAYRAALRIKDNYPLAHFNLGTALREGGLTTEAIESLRRAVELQPDFVEAENDLGSALREAGRVEEAVEVLRKATVHAPRFFMAHNNLGNALRLLGRLDEAEAAVREALRIRGDIAEIYVNLGNVLREKEDLAGAIAATREAVRLRPDLADAHQNLGSVLLLAGQYAEGWPEHDWRWRCQLVVMIRTLPEKARWDGSNLEGRTILLQSDAGLGDAIHCARYIPMVADRGGKIVVECAKGLHPLVRGMKGVVQVITENDPLPEYDVHCPIMSLPLAFGTTLETIPSEFPYLRAEETIARKWAERLSEYPKPRVGIVWSGNPKHTHDKNRSIPLSVLLPLGEAGDFVFHSLQVGEASRQASSADGMKVVDHSAELTDYGETAGLVENLDLVIAVDTSVAHLAGAMGKLVWVMLPAAPDWRWMLGREDSPWYPSMRLFRQEKRGEWASVIERMAEALRELKNG